MKKPLVVTDPGVRAAGVLDKALAALGSLPHAVFDQTPSTPTEAGVRAALASYRAHGCDGLIAVGQVAKKYGLYTKITGGQRVDLFGARLEEGFGLGLAGEAGVVEQVEGGAVDGDRYPHVADLGHHAMLIGPPLGKARQIVDHVLAVGVEDMGAVAMDQNSRFWIALGMAVAGQMIPLIENDNPIIGLCQLTGYDGTGKTSSNNDDRTNIFSHNEPANSL
jgi:hypothetical protein